MKEKLRKEEWGFYNMVLQLDEMSRMEGDTNSLLRNEANLNTAVAVMECSLISSTILAGPYGAPEQETQTSLMLLSKHGTTDVSDL